MHYESMQPGYRNLWAQAEIRRTGPPWDPMDRLPPAVAFAKKIFDHRAQYQAVTDATGVPILFLGPVHVRESSLDFKGVLHNGERIIGTGRKTRLVPSGRGPFNSWHAAAIDAVKIKKLHTIETWPIERILYEQERFNGFGYIGKINSPYVWSWTTLQERGKYTADGVYSSGVWDRQPGTAAIMKAMLQLEASIMV